MNLSKLEGGRKIGVLGTIATLIMTIPSPDPITTAIKIGGLAILGIAYFIANASEHKSSSVPK